MIVELTPEERSQVIEGYDQIYEIIRRILMFENEAGRKREHFWGVGFQTIDTIEYVELVALGAGNKVYVSPRELFQLPILLSCPRILVAHNHPSGLPEFSAADRKLTRRLVDAGDMMDIDVMDHLVVTLDRGYKAALHQKGTSPFKGGKGK
jgi:DNA repair protein RadC